MNRTRAARVRLAGLGIAVLLGGALAWLLLGGDLAAVREAVRAAGAWGPLVYLLLHVVLTLVPVPKNLLAGVAGVLFGPGPGILLSWLGSMLAAAFTFALARRLGRDAVASLTGPRITAVEDTLRAQGVVSVLVARLTPFLPFTVVNYGSGISALSWRDYLVGSAVGMLPGSVAYAALGASAGRDGRTFVVAGAVGGLLFVASLLVGYRTRRTRRPPPG